MHCATPPIGSEFQLLLPWLAFSRPLGLPACIKPIFLYISKAREPAARFKLRTEPSRVVITEPGSQCNIAPNRLTQLCVQKREWPRCWTDLLLASFVCLSSQLLLLVVLHLSSALQAPLMTLAACMRLAEQAHSRLLRQ